MKKIVWENKSNGQLCITIPKASGIKSGDIVSVEKEKLKTIVYSFVVADLFNYGHLHFLEEANELGDYHICGILTDNATSEYRDAPIANFEERKAIISNLRCVDMVMSQTSRSPDNNIKKIYEQFPNSKIVLAHGSDWDKIPGEEYIKKINGKVTKIPYYSKLSDKKIQQEINKREEK